MLISYWMKAGNCEWHVNDSYRLYYLARTEPNTNDAKRHLFRKNQENSEQVAFV